MREKYESLSVAVLRDLAKSRNIPGVSGMKKAELVEAMLAQDEVDAEAKAKSEKKTKNEEHHGNGAHNNGQPAEEMRDCCGILEVMQDGYGFIRSENYLPGDNDVYVSPAQIRKFNLKTGDIIKGKTRRNNPTDKFGALVVIENVNECTLEEVMARTNFEDLTPIFPNERIRLEQPGSSVAMRIEIGRAHV